MHMVEPKRRRNRIVAPHQYAKRMPNAAWRYKLLLISGLLPPRKFLSSYAVPRMGFSCSVLGHIALKSFRFYRGHSVSIAAVIGGSVFVLSCWTVIMSATEPMIKAAASSVRKVIVSWANNAPSNTATIGLT